MIAAPDGLRANKCMLATSTWKAKEVISCGNDCVHSRLDKPPPLHELSAVTVVRSDKEVKQ